MNSLPRKKAFRAGSVGVQSDRTAGFVRTLFAFENVQETPNDNGTKTSVLVSR